ncbi:MAG: diguanylate cyclase [Gammaproteobacteria bacterium]|nr:diguanylate cyclase [Gammaproteobacteria bacterium]
MYNYQNNYIPRNDSRILIAEDDPAHAEAMRRALETAHWTNIEVVENLQQFRARSIALPPTIALVDLNLPDGRANDLLLQRTTEDKFPLIVITNTNDIKTVIDVMKAGAFDYLIKSPDTFNELPRRLLHILTQWEILQQRTEFSNEINMIYKLSLDMICIARFNGYFHRVNPAFERTLGYSSTLLCSKPFIEFVHPDDRAATERAFSDLINGGASKFINRFRASSGEFYWFEWNASIAPTKDTVYAVARDITERRNSETLLMQYKTALDTTHDGFMTFDAHGCLLETNGAFSALMGYRAEALRGMRFEEIEKQEPMDGRAGKHIEDVIERGWSLFETELRHSDGHAIEVEISASFIPDTQKIVAFCRDISSRKAAEKKIEHLAFYDPLTDLPNRSLLLDRLQKSLRSFTRSRSGGALLFIDLDDFKMLNDTLGHDMGDLLLKMVAERLTTCVRTGDTVARMGGDEFVVMLTDLSQTPMKAAAQTTSIVTKIIQTLNVEYPLASRLYRITPSIGATVFSHEFSAEEHMKQADIAMYQAKKQGKNTFCFFDPAMQAKINARALLESDLRIAVEKNQFQLYFQTQVDRYLRPLGAEVLVRWIHPEHGVVRPQNSFNWRKKRD